MLKRLRHSNCFAIFVTCAVMTLSEAHAETFAFSYTFAGNFEPEQTWAPGATLTGQIEGTIDPLNADRVIIDAFRQVVLTRPALQLPVFEFDAIDASEFNAASADGATPVMSFSGTLLDFRSCPEGFTEPGDCPFATAPGGGFLMSYAFFGGAGLATAADGSGSGEECGDGRRLRGCRVADAPILVENWGLVVLPNSADVDPSAVIGSGSTIKKGAFIGAGARLGTNVIVNKDAVIGANATIGNDSNIKKGVLVCPGINVGTAVTIGKNRLVDTDVPDGIVWNDANTPPDPAACP